MTTQQQTQQVGCVSPVGLLPHTHVPAQRPEASRSGAFVMPGRWLPVITVDFSGWQEVAHLIDGLLEAADRWETERPSLARRYRMLADRIGDELDKLPNPSEFRADIEREATP